MDDDATMVHIAVDPGISAAAAAASAEAATTLHPIIQDNTNVLPENNVVSPITKVSSDRNKNVTAGFYSLHTSDIVATVVPQVGTTNVGTEVISDVPGAPNNAFCKVSRVGIPVTTTALHEPKHQHSNTSVIPEKTQPMLLQQL